MNLQTEDSNTVGGLPPRLGQKETRPYDGGAKREADTTESKFRELQRPWMVVEKAGNRGAS